MVKNNLLRTCLVTLFTFLTLTQMTFSEEVLYKDEALFKVQNQIYFSSDVTQIIQDLKKVRESFPRSLLLIAVAWSDADFANSLQDPSRIFLEKVINLLKIHSYLKNQNYSQKTKTEAEKTQNPWLKDEIILRDRFSEASFWSSEKKMSEGLQQFTAPLFRQISFEMIKVKK